LFLFDAVWVVLAMILWRLAFSGAMVLPTRFDPISRHTHEFLFRTSLVQSPKARSLRARFGETFLSLPFWP
jgi:hypothetical protein